MNAMNINSFHSPTKFSRPDTYLTTYTILSLFSRSSSLVTLARPSVSSSLQITNRSFRCASPYLWNPLPSSFCQPHSVHSPSLLLVHLILHISPHHSHHLRSDHLSLPWSLTQDLKVTYLFYKSFPP